MAVSRIFCHVEFGLQLQDATCMLRPLGLQGLAPGSCATSTVPSISSHSQEPSWTNWDWRNSSQAGGNCVELWAWHSAHSDHRPWDRDGQDAWKWKDSSEDGGGMLAGVGWGEGLLSLRRCRSRRASGTRAGMKNQKAARSVVWETQQFSKQFVPEDVLDGWNGKNNLTCCTFVIVAPCSRSKSARSHLLQVAKSRNEPRMLLPSGSHSIYRCFLQLEISALCAPSFSVHSIL